MSNKGFDRKVEEGMRGADQHAQLAQAVSMQEQLQAKQMMGMREIELIRIHGSLLNTALKEAIADYSNNELSLYADGAAEKISRLAVNLADTMMIAAGFYRRQENREEPLLG
jgi:hypothetical protein